MNVKSALRSPIVRLVLAVIVGALLGKALGERARVLGELGVLVVRLLKALATPLVFFAIVDSFARTKIHLRQGLRLLAICVINATIAGALAVFLSSTFRPGLGVVLDGSEPKSSAAAPHASLLAAMSELIPESIVEPFSKNAVLTVVVLALIAGVALRSLRSQGSGDALEKIVSQMFEWLTTILHGVIQAVPLAILGVVAKVTGTSGFAVFKNLGSLVLVVSLGLAIHVFVYYTLVAWLVARRSPRVFLSAAREAQVVALGTGSSMASLPVTLRVLEEKLGVSKASARLAACVGTNFNNDGIMLYEVVAALFVADMSGIHLNAGQTFSLCLTSAAAAAGIAGVPEAGLITLSLVLTSVGLPVASLPILLTVDWMLGRMRAATNVTSDILVASLLDRFEPGAPDEPEVA